MTEEIFIRGVFCILVVSRHFLRSTLNSGEHKRVKEHFRIKKLSKVEILCVVYGTLKVISLNCEKLK